MGNRYLNRALWESLPEAEVTLLGPLDALGIWAGLAALAFAVTSGVFGVAFVGLWPLLAWGAFVVVHLGSRWVLQRLETV